ncbi:DJ-1/PfpI family protein [Streptomyces wuyuanensis]|uniref:DJ-1/PfpI family protein n=1 Tax=Streptomyces wuyuanensis TaxID=1196353 RepID=A0A1G9YL61_9ACTN|nr:DJ-1/PfpI family protein [Streptomyces wuyuanensis]
MLLGRTLATELPALLRAAMAEPEVTVGAVCGGSLVLAMAGLLEGRRATTHHMGLDMLDAAGVHVVNGRVVDDGDLVTGAGVTSGLDLGLYLLERGVGPRIAHAVEALFAHERRGTLWRNHGPAPAALRTPWPVTRTPLLRGKNRHVRRRNLGPVRLDAHRQDQGRGRVPAREGALTGTAHGAGEEVPLGDVVLDGDRLTWSQAVTKPLRLNPAFTVRIDGDTLTGTSRAGRLPASKVTGVRRTGRAGAEHRP